jgi:hypothetical protein
MLLHIDHVRLASAADDFGLAMPKSLTDAEALHTAALALLAGVHAEAEPNVYDITLKNLKDVHTALVAWPSHAAREEAAARLVQVAAGKVQRRMDAVRHEPV